MHVSRMTVLGLTVGVIAVGLFAGLLATGAIGQGDGPSEGGPSAEKLAFEEAERQWEEAAQNAPRAPKDFDTTGVLSCPIDLAAVTIGISDASNDSSLFSAPPFRTIKPVNMATSISAGGVAYDVYAGSMLEDQEQGVLIVAQRNGDPCAAAAGLAPRTPEPALYKTPFRSGSVTLTQLDGTTVICSTADGTTGSFDYTKGQFSPERVAPG